jgi:hypothetical protein
VTSIGIGIQFGLLTVLRESGTHETPNGTKFRMVLCRCQCGIEKSVRWSELIRLDRKRTVSCGCHRIARNRSSRPPVAFVHGLTNRHGCHYLYTTWKGIKRRCFSPSLRDFHSYGGRGITMFSEWINDPAAFASYIIATLGERPVGCSLDRTNNNGDYVPGNLRWASPKQQVSNRRSSSEWLPWGTLAGRIHP